MGIIIETDRLIVRPTQMSDAWDIFHEYASGENVSVNARWKRNETIEETRQLIETIFIGKENVFAIVLKESGKVIGNIGLIDDPKREYDRVWMMGYALGEAYWGRGYMTEVAKVAVEYGFGTLDLVMISAYCSPPMSGIVVFSKNWALNMRENYRFVKSHLTGRFLIMSVML